MTDWATVSALATAGGTLVLAVATFASVRSANKTARAAERSLMAGIRPVLVPSRFEDRPEKVGFIDNRWIKVDGGRAAIEVGDDAIYFVVPLRNVGSGLAVLDRWNIHPGRARGDDYGDPDAFRRLTRDIYVPAGDLGFWQGALRDPSEAAYREVSDAVRDRTAVTVDLLYGDIEGGQRIITRFALMPAGEGQWIAAVSRHWSLDRPNPR